MTASGKGEALRIGCVSSQAIGNATLLSFPVQCCGSDGTQA
ncbi:MULTISPECIES: hypothetical protein [Gluconobacter]|nr:hypothetical protein [Gluconobacter cerevisiae]